MTLAVEGEVEHPRAFALDDLAALPGQVADVAAVVPGREGRGVWLRSVAAATGARRDARFATLVADDGRFAIAVPLAPLLARAVVVYALGDAPLPAAKGGPLRLVLADAAACGAAGDDVDACAAVKRLGRVRLTREREPDVGHAHRAAGEPLGAAGAADRR